MAGRMYQTAIRAPARAGVSATPTRPGPLAPQARPTTRPTMRPPMRKPRRG